jgi:hypothetical protein
VLLHPASAAQTPGRSRAASLSGRADLVGWVWPALLLTGFSAGPDDLTHYLERHPRRRQRSSNHIEDVVTWLRITTVDATCL